MRIKSPKTVQLALSLAIGLLFVAGPGARAAPAFTVESALAGPATQAAAHHWRIAFIPKYTNFNQQGALSPYWQLAWESAQKAGADLGVTVKLVTAEVRGSTDEENVDPQIRLVADLIAHGGFDGLLIAPFDSDRLAPVVDKAIAAGIPTVAMDTPVNTDRLLTFVAVDNFAAGRALGQWVVRRLGGKGQALILDGPLDQQNAVDRRKGFLAGLQTGNIDILRTESADWDIEPARRITAAWLQKYAAVHVILAANDDMAIGAAQAVAAVKRPGILITGFDATDSGLAAIQSGGMSATVDQAPGEQARLAIQFLVRHLETGETFPSVCYLPGITLVTKDNVDAYLSRKGLK